MWIPNSIHWSSHLCNGDVIWIKIIFVFTVIYASNFPLPPNKNYVLIELKLHNHKIWGVKLWNDLIMNYVFMHGQNFWHWKCTCVFSHLYVSLRIEFNLNLCSICGQYYFSEFCVIIKGLSAFISVFQCFIHLLYCECHIISLSVETNAKLLAAYVSRSEAFRCPSDCKLRMCSFWPQQQQMSVFLVSDFHQPTMEDIPFRIHLTDEVHCDVQTSWL
jgi:hypothetical protein